jgi:hypothetical protein
MPANGSRTRIKPLGFRESGFGSAEWKILKSLSTPRKIQDFINKLPFNFEAEGETYMSVNRSLAAGTAHCFEGALIAAAALWVHGERPILLDLNADPDKDDDHVVALFQRDGYWGAISKTNHAVLRYREPLFRDVRELTVSYFHEYFLEDGIKTLRSFSEPFDLIALLESEGSNINWLSGDENLVDLVNALEAAPHTRLLSKSQRMGLRKADAVEIDTLDITEYATPDWYYR